MIKTWAAFGREMYDGATFQCQELDGTWANQSIEGCTVARLRVLINTERLRVRPPPTKLYWRIVKEECQAKPTLFGPYDTPFLPPTQLPDEMEHIHDFTTMEK